MTLDLRVVMGSVATIEGCGAIESGFSSRCVMLTDRKLRIARKAYSAGLAATQMAEHPSVAVIAERPNDTLLTGLEESDPSSLRG